MHLFSLFGVKPVRWWGYGLGLFCVGTIVSRGYAVSRKMELCLIFYRDFYVYRAQCCVAFFY